MRTRWWLALIWAGFGARLAFYATAYPLWEGFDEWAYEVETEQLADPDEGLSLEELNAEIAGEDTLPDEEPDEEPGWWQSW